MGLRNCGARKERETVRPQRRAFWYFDWLPLERCRRFSGVCRICSALVSNATETLGTDVRRRLRRLRDQLDSPSHSRTSRRSILDRSKQVYLPVPQTCEKRSATRRGLVVMALPITAAAEPAISRRS